MTDQLDGEWFLRMSGIGGNLSDGRIRDILRVILKQNFNQDSGLINASCPEGRSTTLYSYKNCQALATWTGIGYVTAALCLSVGMRDDSDALVTAVYDNQACFGALWDHWECGHHYTRPMSSWTTLTAALGLETDSARRIIRLKPASDNITLPLCLPGFLGTAEVKDGSVLIHTAEGSLDGWTVLTDKTEE